MDLEWIALSDADRAAAASISLTAKHALLLAVGLRYRRMRSSMLAAIERGRTPAIDLRGKIPCSCSQGTRVYQLGFAGEFRLIGAREGGFGRDSLCFPCRSGNLA